MVLSNFRFAAGACVLATGLFLGGAGGAIAVAAADSNGSNTHSHDGANGSSQGSSPASRVSSLPSSITNTVRETLQGVTTKLGSGPKSGLQASTGVTGPQTLPGGTNITGPQNEPNPVAAVPNPGKQVPNPVAQIPNAAAPVTKVFAPPTNGGTPPTNLAPPLTNLATSLVNLPAAVAASLTGGLTAPADVIDAIPILLAPAFDAITVLQDIVVTVAHGVLPLIQLPFQLPSEIASLFGITLGLPPAVGPPTIFDYPPAVASVPTAPSAASPLPASPLSQPLAPLAPADVPPMVGNAAGLAALGGIATSHLSRESSLPDQDAPTPLGARIEQVLAHVGRAIGEALRSVSLAELAAAALPGLGGLLIFTGAGVRAGHRQAKFGFAVQTAGIARFARTGPLGVVRSQHLVTTRRRKARAESRLDEAA